MSVLRTGVIGVGHLGYHHARLYGQLDGVELVGVVDLDASNRKRAEDELGVSAYASIEELLVQGVDAVSVVTPTMTHATVVLQVLEAGVHVLVEKPIAPTLEEAEAMVCAARANGKRLQVGHIERFNGAVMALFDAIKAPRFVECHRLSPFPGRGTDVSVVLDLMIHDLDIILTLDRSELISIDAVGVPVFSDTEDIANVRLRFASGCVMNLTASRVSVDKMRKIRIFEDNAYVSTDYDAKEVLIYRKKPGEIEDASNPMAHIEIEALEVSKDEQLKLELASFVECVREDKRPVVNGEDGVRALKLARDIVNFIEEHGPKERA